MKPQIGDQKSSLGSRGEADECLFEYLHAEMIDYVLSKTPSETVWFCLHLSLTVVYNS